jgi:hypothetical protein
MTEINKLNEQEYCDLLNRFRKETCSPVERKINIVGYPMAFEWGRPREKYCEGYGEPSKILTIYDKKDNIFYYFEAAEKSRIVEIMSCDDARQDIYIKNAMRILSKNIIY